tara:strand:- start:668 stop:1126 length:459 start_codon:yes stop_codon:yes gene_type:complete
MGEVDWERFSDPVLITPTQMLSICLVIEVVLQGMALMVEPTEWWTWQLLAFITATNLGAVVLAILAQRSAHQISSSYKAVFTPAFYRTMRLVSQFQHYFQEEAEKEGRDFNAEIEEIAPKLWSVLRAKLDVEEPLPTLAPLEAGSGEDLFPE